jgi:hypothetical protein
VSTDTGPGVAAGPEPGRQSAAEPSAAAADLSKVFHRLNNQLGVVLANAELLEARLSDETHRARAGQVVAGALEAIAAVQELRRLAGPADSSPR